MKTKTEEIAKDFAAVLVRKWAQGRRNSIERDVYEAILELNLIQSEPIPEGAVPVVVYVGVGPLADDDGRSCVLASAVDIAAPDDLSMGAVFRPDDTHRVRLEGYALPVAVPTVKAVSRPV